MSRWRPSEPASLLSPNFGSTFVFHGISASLVCEQSPGARKYESDVNRLIVRQGFPLPTMFRIEKSSCLQNLHPQWQSSQSLLQGTL
jgi:hypothetical protein